LASIPKASIPPARESARTGQRIAFAGMAVSGALAVAKILIGLAGHSTAAVADGVESSTDLLTSSLLLAGLTLGAKPADENHPYGHGRVEILSGMLIGLGLAVLGALISYSSIERLGRPHPLLQPYVVWPLVASLAAKPAMAFWKFRYGRKIQSAAMVADAWHDATDSTSAATALIAVGLSLYNPGRFVAADCYGGLAVGLLVIAAGARVAYQTAMQLMDTMPDDRLMDEIRRAASEVEGVRGVEKCYARKTGLRYHVDLHLEVDPDMTVRQSHEIAHQARLHILKSLDWVADVLVHVEPAP
jgi:cation diffusion facilitator family transporter